MTLFTIFELFCICFFGVGATVTSIPIAFPVVVVIVADAIAFVFQDSAIRFLEVEVKTLAIEAEFHLFRIACMATAVATVPTTAASVVIIIAVIVTLVFGATAFAGAFFGACVGSGVETCTILTVPVLTRASEVATVAGVEITFLHVVCIVTEVVTHVAVDTFGSLVFGVQT